MLWVALTAVVLTPIRVLKEAPQCLYVSALALIGPWSALGRVRVAYRPGRVRDWVIAPLLYCAPLALCIGLLWANERLGLFDENYGLALLPALFVSAFVVLCVGPWLVLLALSPTVGRTAAGRCAGAVATGAALVTGFWLTDGWFLYILFFLGLGSLPAVLYRLMPRGPLKGSRRPPADVGYLPRKDDDPFA